MHLKHYLSQYGLRDFGSAMQVLYPNFSCIPIDNQKSDNENGNFIPLFTFEKVKIVSKPSDNPKINHSNDKPIPFSSRSFSFAAPSLCFAPPQK